ncbi:MAG: hypothetical protein EA397_17210 [Deltaproteobacteria bacterium]|nr:MAG: hypothetical protein EA397_17210 [Deltaproteobacteria bacterium]
MKRVQSAVGQAVEKGQETSNSIFDGIASLTGYGNAADTEHVGSGVEADADTPTLSVLEAGEEHVEAVRGWDLVLQTFQIGLVAEAAHAWEHMMESERAMLDFARAHPEIVQAFLPYTESAEEFVRRAAAGKAGHDMYADDIPLPELSGMVLNALSEGDTEQALRLFYGLPGDEARMEFGRQNPRAIEQLLDTNSPLIEDYYWRLHDELHPVDHGDHSWSEEQTGSKGSARSDEPDLSHMHDGPVEEGYSGFSRIHDFDGQAESKVEKADHSEPAEDMFIRRHL